MPFRINPFTGTLSPVIEGTDVSVSNPNNILYIKGDESTDGSIRLVFTENDVNAHLEKRANGVWNDTGLRISSSSLFLGRDMVLSAIAGFLETSNPSNVIGHQRSLLPHIQFSESGTDFPHIPFVSALATHVAFSGAVSEIIGKSIGITLGVTPGRIIDQSIHEVGTIGASKEIIVSLYTGTDNTGLLFNRKTLPSSDMVANTTLTIEYGEDLGFDTNIPIFMEFVSEENISLKTDASGNPLTTHLGHVLKEGTLVTESVMLDENLGIMFDESLNPMYEIQFA